MNQRLDPSRVPESIDRKVQAAIGIDLTVLLAETEIDPPCGPNLEYDPAVLELERTAGGKAEQQFGDTIIAGEEPNWAAVRRQSEALLARTKDLRIAMHLLQALTRAEHLLGLYAGLYVIQQLLEHYWDHVHPRLDPDDDNDPTMRMNAIAPLTNAETFLRALRQASVVAEAGVGRVSVRDILAMQGKASVGEGEHLASPAELEEMFRRAGARGQTAIEALRESAQVVRGIQALLGEKVGTSRAPDLAPLSSLLNTVSQACSAFSTVTTEAEASPAEVQSGAETAGGPASPPAAPAVGELRSRTDALRMLDQVCEFLERSEPGHPAPLLIRRAQRLMAKNFVEIIEDLAPDSLSQIRRIAGMAEE